MEGKKLINQGRIGNCSSGRIWHLFLSYFFLFSPSVLTVNSQSLCLRLTLLYGESCEYIKIEAMLFSEKLLSIARLIVGCDNLELGFIVCAGC